KDRNERPDARLRIGPECLLDCPPHLLLVHLRIEFDGEVAHHAVDVLSRQALVRPHVHAPSKVRRRPKSYAAVRGSRKRWAARLLTEKPERSLCVHVAAPVGSGRLASVSGGSFLPAVQLHHPRRATEKEQR